MPFIIWGSRNVINTQSTGQFLCPRCNQLRNYRHQNARRFFTLYFVPIFPLEDLGQFVECTTCLMKYQTGVLYQSNNNTKRLASEMNVAMKRMLALMVLADGEPQDKEVESMRSVYNKITNSDLSLEAIREELEFAKADTRTVRYVIGNFTSNLNPDGKDSLVAAACTVALSDGELKPQEHDFLNALGAALGLTGTQVSRTIERLQKT